MTFKQIRMRSGFTQTELAELTGLRQAQLCQYEKGHNKPGLPALRKLLKVLDCTADELINCETWGGVE